MTPLAGVHQAMNAAVAIEMLEHVPDDLRPTRTALLAGVRGVRHHGRNEIRTIDGVTWLFDVAHNPAGIATLVDTLERLALPRPRVALVGVLADKDWLQMLPPICDRLDHVFLTQPRSAPADRRWDPVGAASALRPILSHRCVLDAAPDFGAALEAARAAAGTGTVIVTGSSHTVGDALRLLGRCPFHA